MDPTTFDRITKLFARRRLSRRQALTGSAGLAAGALAATGYHAAAGAPAPQPAAREGFTVLDQPAPGATAIATPTVTGAKPTTFLFLQSFERGSLAPLPGSPGRYTLTLTQGLGDTVFFSDRPAKIVGTVPTQTFLDGLGFTPTNPPNAALVGQRDATHKDVVVVELFNPHYDASANTLTYEVTLLQDWHKLDETFDQTPDDEAHLPRDFTAAHLFIDDCPDLANCVTWYGVLHGPIPGGPFGRCWNWSRFTCYPCSDVDPAALNDLCNRTYPACQGQCVAAE